MKRLAQTTNDLQFCVTVNFVAINPHLISTSTQIKHRTFPKPSVATSLHFTSTEEPPLGHQWGSKTFCNFISGLKQKTIF